MIFKKPYAFLIKYFRIIHIVLFLLVGFLCYKYFGIISFFNDYISNGYRVVTSSGLAQTYTSFSIFLANLLIIILSGAILYLLFYKKKPYRLYLFMIIYYVILFCGLFYLRGLFSSLAEELLSATLSRSVRDVVLIAVIPQFIFIVYTFVRAIGFDIKKFDFSSDVKEMNLSSKDSEEFEVNINIDSYKTQRKAKKSIREIKYYLIENKFILICVGVVILLISGILIYTNLHTNYDKTYSETRSFIYNKLNYVVKESFVSNQDYQGNIIKNDSHFVIVNVNVKNSSGDVIKIDINDFKLSIGNELINPNVNYLANFIDLGYKDSSYTIAPSTEKKLSLIYEIDSSQVHKKMKLQINNGVVYDKNTYINKHIFININPKLIEEQYSSDFSLNDMVSFASTGLGNSSLIITDYEFTKKYIYTYEKEENGNINTYKDIINISPVNNHKNNTLIVLSVNYIQDYENKYSYNYQSISAFANNFIKINGEGQNVTPSNIENKIVFAVPSSIMDSESINVNVKIRNFAYNIKIK